jgi:ribonuclease HI
MPWARKAFKGGKVYARVDDAGNLVVEDGRVEIKYREEDERTYRAAARSVTDLGEAPASSVADRRAVSAPPPGRRPKAAASARRAAASRPDAIHIYTDGACTGNPGPAGIGVVLLYRGHRKELSEYLGHGTNNVAELTAVLRGLQAVKDPTLPVDVCLDSAYSIGVLVQGWKAKANQHLIAAIHREMARFRDLRLVKVEGHAGVRENERADELAREAVSRGMARGHSSSKL